MSDPDAVIRIDPALRVAITIARQEGVPEPAIERMYTKTVLGEVPATAMLTEIKRQVTSEAAKSQVQAVIDSLPLYASESTVRTSSGNTANE